MGKVSIYRILHRQNGEIMEVNKNTAILVLVKDLKQR